MTSERTRDQLLDFVNRTIGDGLPERTGVGMSTWSRRKGKKKRFKLHLQYRIPRYVLREKAPKEARYVETA